jgi:protein TonB
MNSASTAANFTEFNVLEQLGCPHFVRLQDRVVKSLEAHLKASAGPESEMGALTGSRMGGSTCVIEISGFRPLPVNQRSEAGIQRYLTAIPKANLIGYFKTVPEGAPDHAISEADREMARRFFRKETAVVLVLKRSGDLYTGVFSLILEGEFHPGHLTVEFPLNLRELGAEEVEKPDAAGISAGIESATTKGSTPVLAASPKLSAAQTTAAAKSPLVATPVAGPSKQAPSGSKTGKTIAIAVATILMIGAGIWGLQMASLRSHADTPAQALVESTKPATFVEANVARQEPPVDRPSGTAATSAQPAPRPVTPAASTASTVIAVPRETIRSTPAINAPAISAKGANTPVAPDSEATIARNPEPLPARGEPVPAHLASTSAASVPPAVVAPPAVQPAPAQAQQAPPVSNAQPAPIPAVPATREVAVKPPAPLRQVAPVIPSAIRKNMTADVSIRLRVQVDAAGNVASAATAASPGDAIGEALARAAVDAIKKWKFTPALQGTQPVAAETVLSFTFRR